MDLYAQSTRQVQDEIVNKIQSQSNPASQWYVGVTSNWKHRLFAEHKVQQKNTNTYIVCRCKDSDSARWVEKVLQNLGCEGGTGGGDESAVFVYAYLKVPGQTEP